MPRMSQLAVFPEHVPLYRSLSSFTIPVRNEMYLYSPDLLSGGPKRAENCSCPSKVFAVRDHLDPIQVTNELSAEARRAYERGKAKLKFPGGGLIHEEKAWKKHHVPPYEAINNYFTRYGITQSEIAEYDLADITFQQKLTTAIECSDEIGFTILPRDYPSLIKVLERHAPDQKAKGSPRPHVNTIFACEKPFCDEPVLEQDEIAEVRLLTPCEIFALENEMAFFHFNAFKIAVREFAKDIEPRLMPFRLKCDMPSNRKCTVCEQYLNDGLKVGVDFELLSDWQW